MVSSIVGCGLPSEIVNNIPRDVSNKRQYIIDALEAKSSMEAIIGNKDAGDTQQINLETAQKLRSQIDTNIIKTRGVFFDFPILIKALMVTKGANSVSELWKENDKYNIKDTGFFVVFGKYDNTHGVNSNKHTCYISFAKRNGDGTVSDIITESALPTSGSQSAAFLYYNNQPIPLMFNFGSLCPSYCPESLSNDE